MGNIIYGSTLSTNNPSACHPCSCCSKVLVADSATTATITTAVHVLLQNTSKKGTQKMCWLEFIYCSWDEICLHISGKNVQFVWSVRKNLTCSTTGTQLFQFCIHR